MASLKIGGYAEVSKKRASKENAEIYWGDETGIRNDCQHSRGYAPKGQTPIVEISAKRFSTNMISAINSWEGHLWQGRFFSSALDDPIKIS